MDTPRKRRQGFAAIDPEKARKISRLGGLAAQAKGVAHRLTSETARAAGQIGGKAVSRDRAHMAAIGRLGGLAGKGRKHQRRSK